MALNFEENFTKPLSADLTQGRIKGADDFANAIVKYYIDTVTEGMPVGVPPTLPAPGLNPITPPPFTIGVSAVKVNPLKEKAMLTILSAYFTAKDMEVTKGAIKGLKESITQTTNRLKQKKKEITNLVVEIKQASVELKNLPKYIEEVIEGAKEIVIEEKAKIQGLQTFFSDLKEESKTLGMDESQFQSTFALELDLVNSLKDFELKSFGDFAKIPDLIAKAKRIVSKLRGESRSGAKGLSQSSIKYNDIKVYVLDKLFEVILSYGELANIILDPTGFLSYVERLAKRNPKIYRLYRGMQKLDAVERFIKPQIARLKKQLAIKKKEIKDFIQPKLDLIQKKLEDKVKELTTKEDKSMKTNLYTKTSKRVKEFKEEHAEFIKKKKEEIKIVQKIITKSNKLVKQSTALQKDLVVEFDNIKNELVLLKEDATASVAKYKNLTNDAKKQLADRAALPLIPTNIEKLTPADPNLPPSISIVNSQTLVNGYERSIDSTADLQRTREIRKEAAAKALKDQQSSGPTEEQVLTYMNEMGLGDFSKTAFKVIAESKADLKSFKHLFETKRNQFESYKLTIEDMVTEVQNILTMLQELSESKGPIGTTAAWAKERVTATGNKIKNTKVGRFVTGVGVSLMGLFMDLIAYLKPLIKKALAWAKKLINKFKAFIKNKIAKFEKDIESFLLNLIPLKGHQAQKTKDAEEKKKILDAKRRKAEDIKEKIKHYQKLGVIVGKISRGAAGLSKNLIKEKNYLFPVNETHITNIVNGIFDYKKEEQGDSAQLQTDKELFSTRMKEIATVDALITGIISLLKGMQEAFKRGLKQDLDAFTLSLQQSGSPYVAGWNQLMLIFNTPIADVKALGKTIIGIVRNAEAITKITKAFESLEIVSFLTRLETKYLGKARQLLKTYAEEPIGDNPEHHQTMQQWLDVLDKRQSIFLFLISKLEDVVDRFFLFLNKQVKVFVDDQKRIIKKKLAALKDEHEVNLQKIKDKLVNVEAVFMSIALDLAARAFWTGARWQGDTGTNHLSLTIGVFKKIKALPEDGAVSMVEEIATSLELQLKTMTGLVIPPANTGIAPIPFQGYI